MIGPNGIYPIEDLADTGLLWLINRVVFHPRGWALALHIDTYGKATGWSLLGDGIEPWSMGDDPTGTGRTETEILARVEALLAPHPAEPLPNLAPAEPAPRQPLAFRMNRRLVWPTDGET
jgi:hypothetical protein